jgi:(2Fe-2S) ferredoxin
MGKPFKVTSPGDAGIGRNPDGTFTRVVPPSPPQIVRKSIEEGKPVERVIEENRSPEHPIPKGGPKNAADEIPWPEAGPFNDANKSPMRLD